MKKREREAPEFTEVREKEELRHKPHTVGQPLIMR